VNVFTLELHNVDEETVTLVCADPDGAGNGRTYRFPARWVSRSAHSWIVEVHHENGAGVLLMADTGDLSTDKVYASVCVVRSGQTTLPHHPSGHSSWPGMIHGLGAPRPVIAPCPKIDADWFTAIPADTISSWEECEAWWISQVLVPAVGRGEVCAVEVRTDHPDTWTAFAVRTGQ
jgi:hypothetical protein